MPPTYRQIFRISFKRISIEWQSILYSKILTVISSKSNKRLLRYDQCNVMSPRCFHISPISLENPWKQICHVSLVSNIVKARLIPSVYYCQCTAYSVSLLLSRHGLFHQSIIVNAPLIPSVYYCQGTAYSVSLLLSRHGLFRRSVYYCGRLGCGQGNIENVTPVCNMHTQALISHYYTLYSLG
jgi:hypothetical protein